MSENYKIINKAKEVALQLIARAWTSNQIVIELGISHGLYQEIINYDPVSVKVQDVTIDKLKVFLEKHENIIQPKPKRKGAKPKIVSSEDEFKIQVPESMQDSIPDKRGIERGPYVKDGTFVDLLDDLNALSARFKLKGYKLDPVITKYYEPK